MKEVIFKNEIARLRKPVLEDAEALMELTHDQDVMRYYGMEPFRSVEESQNEIKWFLGLFDKNCGRWVIADTNTNVYIGDIGFFNYQEEHRRVEIGFKLSKQYWKRNIMSDCMRTVLEAGFTTFGYNRIEAFVEKNNVPCKKLLSKMNFSGEGLLREYVYEFNNFVDLEIYSLLKREYITLAGPAT
ncbi:MAG: GNAT family N-acetyltransferase [Spirochaetales bacterium]|nr:GNAT family N-acetyltransferase [Spirochaetales bacterium]